MAEFLADKVILYSFFRSSASWRVRIALALKGIKYDYAAINALKDGGEQHSEQYKAMNPLEQLPCLLIDGHRFTQSLPIMEYLDERSPDPPLLPKDLAAKTEVRALSEVINSGIQPLVNLSVLQKVGDTQVEWAAHFIAKGFKALEAMLQECAGKYCYGDSITMADLCLGPQIYAAERFKVDMSQFPTISRINAALQDLPAFKVADYRRQPDTPEDLRID